MYEIPQYQPYKQPKQYEHIQSKLDTGYNSVKYMRDHQESMYAKNKTNIAQQYKKIKLSTLQNWVETAMIVLSTKIQNQQQLSREQLEQQRNKLQETLSTVYSQATFCCNEQGVPAMYMCGPDILDQREQQSIDILVTQKFNSIYDVEQTSTQRQNKYAKQKILSSQLAQIIRNDDLPQQKPLSVRQQQQDLAYQALTTRQKYEELIDYITQNPDNQQYELQLYKDQVSNDKILVPNITPSYNFVIIDMRPDKEEFDACHIWGSVHLPLSLLHRANAHLPGTLELFAKYQQSLFVVVGLYGKQLETALLELQQFGIRQKQIIPFLQTFDDIKEQCNNLLIYQ